LTKRSSPGSGSGSGSAKDSRTVDEEEAVDDLKGDLDLCLLQTPFKDSAVAPKRKATSNQEDLVQVDLVSTLDVRPLRYQCGNNTGEKRQQPGRYIQASSMSYQKTLWRLVSQMKLQRDTTFLPWGAEGSRPKGLNQSSESKRPE